MDVHTLTAPSDIPEMCGLEQPKGAMRHTENGIFMPLALWKRTNLPGAGWWRGADEGAWGGGGSRGRLWRVGWRRRADREMSVAGSTVGCVISPSVTAQARDESGVPAGLR